MYHVHVIVYANKDDDYYYYNSVPTSVDELSSLRDVMNRNIIVFEKGTITSEIVKTCISKLNSGKDDGDIGFKSDHIINVTYRLNVLLSLLFIL